MTGTVYLIPSILAEGAGETIPAYVIFALKKCSVIFAENERTARRFLKLLDRDFVIDDFEWFTIHKAEEAQLQQFRDRLRDGKNIAVLSEAGCPGVADPGQMLVAAAQEMHAQVRPLTGPSSILLALMASGMNGQHFEFIGYLPVDNIERQKKLAALEADSKMNGSTKIFIETPYRNDQLLQSILKTCAGKTRLCIAADLTSAAEFIKTMPVAEWKKELPVLHKRPVIFLLQAG